MLDIILYRPLFTSQREEKNRQLYYLKFKLRELTIELTTQEIELTNLETEIYLFERQYFSSLSHLLTHLNEIKAEIAEFLATKNPHNLELQLKAQIAREKAEVSKQGYKCKQDKNETEFKPSKGLKKLFHGIAKLIHPDLSTNPMEKHMRHLAFLELKKAYETGSQERLEFFLQNLRENKIQSFPQEGEENKETEEDVAKEILELNTQILQVKNRLESIKSQIEALKQHPFSELRQKAITSEQKGQNLLSQMARQLKNEIKTLEQHLKQLKGEN